MSQALKISSLHMSDKDLPVLKIILSLTNKDPQISWNYTDDAHLAAALVIDIDSPEGAEVWADLAANNHQALLIACTGKEYSSDENNLVLAKPLRSRTILPVLRQASQRLVEDPPSSTATASPWMQRTLSHFTGLSGRKAVNSTPQEVSIERGADARAMSVKDSTNPLRVLDLFPSDPDKALSVTTKTSQINVVFDRARNRYYVQNRAHQDISNLLLEPASTVTSEIIDRKDLSRKIARYVPLDLDVVLWPTALRISQGQLFTGLSEHDFFRLRRWPDLKRLGFNPLHLKLTALLRKGARSTI